MNMFKSNGGFTLVELIVVIAILAILASVTVPAYGKYIQKAEGVQTMINDRASAMESEANDYLKDTNLGALGSSSSDSGSGS